MSKQTNSPVAVSLRLLLPYRNEEVFELNARAVVVATRSNIYHVSVMDMSSVFVCVCNRYVILKCDIMYESGSEISLLL